MIWQRGTLHKMYKEYIKRIEAIEAKHADKASMDEWQQRTDAIVNYLLNNPAPNRNIYDFESDD